MFRSLFGCFFGSSRPIVDNIVFRLHYRVTVGLLIACAAALLFKINFDNPIDCVNNYRFPTDYMNDLCWHQGTFTIPSARSKKVGVEVPYPGIDLNDSSEKEYHNMHRWVVFALLAQAVAFYLPRVLWQCLEGRLVERWTCNMNDPKKTANVDNFRKEEIARQLKNTRYRNIIYTVAYVLCELHNLINVLFQLFVVSHILQMSSGKLDLLVLSRSERTDASALSSFPINTKCQFFMYGPSGEVQLNECMCVLTVNSIMESIFMYQWIWFALLTVLSFLVVVYRVVSLVFPRFRVLVLTYQANLTNYATVVKVVRRLGMDEWFVLHMLSKNLDPVHTGDILKYLIDGISDKEERYLLSEKRLVN